MSYSHFTSFAPTTVYDPSGVDGITCSMEHSFHLDSHLHKYASIDLVPSWAESRTDDAHCERLSHSGLPVVFDAAEEYHDTPWCSGSSPFAPCDTHTGILLASDCTPGCSPVIEGDISRIHVDPIIIAHPSTWEIASALEDSPSATRSSSLRSSSGSSTSLSLSSPSSSMSFWRNDTGAIDSESFHDVLSPSQPSPDSLDRDMHSSALRSIHVEPSSCADWMSGPSSRHPQGPKKPRRSPTHTRSRLRQVKAEVLALKVSIARGRKDCKCTVCENVFKCRSELWRHMKAHAGEAHGKKWKCCGVPVELAAEYNVARDAKPYRHNGRSMVEQRKGQREAPFSNDPVTGSNTYKTTQPASATDIRPPTLDPPTLQHTICRALKNMQRIIPTTLDLYMAHLAPQTPPATDGDGTEDRPRRHVPCRLRRMLDKMPFHATDSDNEHRNLPPRLRRMANGPKQMIALKLVASKAKSKRSAARSKGPRAQAETQPMRRSARLLEKADAANST
ncbi:predicted protein [Postia placenta Mad-698-R]|nr:predicted protein [Postia placenta Mad-698-R]